MKNMTDIMLFSNDLLGNRKEDGFIEIQKVEFIPESREKMGNDKRIKNWIVTKDQKEYIIKTNAKLEDKENYLELAELIARKIAFNLGIEYAFYDIIKYDGEKGIITENVLSLDEELITLEDIVNGSISHPDNSEIIDYPTLIKKLESSLKELGFLESDIEKINCELSKRLLFDIVIGCTDRHTENISFIYNNKSGRIRLSPIYDSENSLLLEYDKDLVYSLAKNLKGAIDASKSIYPKIAVVPKKCPKDIEIINSTIEFLLNNENPEVEDFAYDMLDNLDIYSILDDVEQDIDKKLPDEIRAIVSTCIETRLQMLNDVLNGNIIVNYDWDYMNNIKNKMKDNKGYKEAGIYKVMYLNHEIGKYIVDDEKDTYIPNVEEIEKLDLKLFPLLNRNIEDKDIVLFSSRINNCKRFGGRIGYQTDNIELVQE